ncbi:unnamed protein product [Microthlaspi erraticum]|uniref:Arabidopsis retrotransposon Orf1 C-terminal domain-containing protein n=1 Tax=Microthlaspi erraticum TaxID=1685480 RepID=A0A6D2HKD5_9BRAS|nr:unnamed protein product [Microthlaspi erraticum]
MESYKELTCEFLAHEHHSLMSSIELSWTKAGGNHGTSRKKNSKEFGLQSLKRGTLPQGPRLLRSGVPVLRYVHKALANTFFARKATGQSMREK